MNAQADSIHDECEATMQTIVGILQTPRDAFVCAPGGARLQRLIEHMVQDGARRGGRREDPVHEVFSLIGDKWSSLVVLLLGSADRPAHGVDTPPLR